MPGNGKGFGKTAVAIVSVVLGAVMFMATPFEGLSPEAMRVLGVLICALGFWIVDFLPEYVTGLGMLSLWVGLCHVPFGKAYSVFAGSAFWMIVGAFAIGAAARKCNLLERLSLYILKYMKPTYGGQIYGLLISGFIISPLIPSINGKAAIAAPIAQNIGESLGFGKKSNGMAGLFGAMFVSFTIAGLAFLSSTGTNYALVAMLPKESQEVVTWGWWAKAFLPWGVMVIAAYGIAMQVFFRPEKKIAMSKEFIEERLARLGRMKREEVICTIIILLTLLAWATEKVHGVGAGVVAVLAMLALIVTGILSTKDFNTLPWSSMIYIGTIVGMASVIRHVAIDKWVGTLISPYMGGVLSSPYLFILAVAGIILVLRFLITSMASSCSLVILIVGPLMAAYGLHPMLIVFLTFTIAAGAFFLQYQNSAYIIAYYATGGEMLNKWHEIKLAVIYVVIAVLAHMISVPYWRMLGVIS
jgi:DASS family divalent anion:Na+ symporter